MTGTNSADSDGPADPADAGEADGHLPPVVWDREDEVAGLFDDADGVLLCSDFDGTLTAIVDDPDAPEIRPGNADALRGLDGHEDVRVALVSGRRIDDLRDRAGIGGIGYAGNHGLEIVLHADHDTDGSVWDAVERIDGEPAAGTDEGDGTGERGDVTVHPVAAAHAGDIERLVETVREHLDVEGLEVEWKGVTATVHHRNAPDERVPEIRETVESVAREVGDGHLRVSEGKAIVEVAPAVDWDKGRAVGLFADDVPDSWLVVYVGDDTTDEHAFRAIDPGGLSIHVGENPDTDARYRLRDPGDVERFLEWLADRLDD
jgi:trehalose 6-phosphate phosphatase